MKARLLAGFLAAACALTASFWHGLPRASAATQTGPPCGEKVFTNDQGISIRILFAKNGAVQRYVIVESHDNIEAVNDLRKLLEAQFGPEGVNAPPVHMTFKAGSNGGMMVPDKAVDSCGRTQSY